MGSPVATCMRMCAHRVTGANQSAGTAAMNRRETTIVTFHGDHVSANDQNEHLPDSDGASCGRAAHRPNPTLLGPDETRTSAPAAIHMLPGTHTRNIGAPFGPGSKERRRNHPSSTQTAR